MDSSQDLPTSLIFTTSASMLDKVDKKIIVVLRDGRKLIGVLRSYDQYANLVLQDTVERIFVDDSYGDIPRGVFIVRGENVVLLGEIDLDKEDELPLKMIAPDEAFFAQTADMEQRKRREKIRNKKLLSLGFSVEQMQDADLY